MAGKQRVASLYAEIGAETKGLDAGLKSAKTGLADSAKAFESLGKTGGGVLDGLGLSIARFAGPVGVGLAVKEIGELAFELGELGGQALITERSFSSVMASIGRTPAMLTELKRAAAGTVTEMRLMQLANTAVAGASAEMGGAFADALPKLLDGARAAAQLNPALGDTEFLFNSLVTGIKRGSPMLIDNLGITLKLGEANEAFARSLGKTVEQLSADEQKLALLNATLEGVDRLTAQAGQGLDELAGASARLKTSWEELRITIGKGFAEATAGAKVDLASALDGVTASLKTMSADAATQLAGLTQQLELAQTELQELKAAPIDPNDEFGTARMRIEQLEGQIITLRTEIERLTPAEADMAERLRESAAAARDAEAATAALTTARISATTTGTFTEPSKTRWGLYTDWARKQGGSGSQGDPVQDWLERTGRATKTAADTYRSQMSTAGQEAATAIGGYLRQAMQASTGLGNMLSNQMAPGANGPFEALFRAQAVATGGIENADEASWAQMYGLTPESAAEIVRKFQQGIFDASVTGLIDQGALLDMINAQQLAQATQEAFIAQLAGQSGANPTLIKGLLGLGEGGQAVTAAVADIDWSGATTQALRADFDQDAALLSAAGAGAGRTVARGIRDGVREGLAGVRYEIANLIAPEVARILQANAAGRTPQE